MMSSRPKNLTIVVLCAFLTFIMSGPLLTSCGGSSGSSADTSSSFGAVQTVTTDSLGQASVTGLASGATINLTLTNSLGAALEGITVDYIEANDASTGMLTIYDPDDVYQTTVINLDSDDLSAAVSAGQSKAVFTALAVITALSTAYAVYSSLNAVREIANDPPQMRFQDFYGTQQLAVCASPNTFMNMADIASTVGSGGSKSVATGAGQAAVELIGGVAADEAISRGVSYAFQQVGMDPDEDVCIIMVSGMIPVPTSASIAVGKDSSSVTQTSRWDNFLAFSNQTCTPNADNTSAVCSSLTVDTLLQSLPSQDDFDSDKDGYTPNQDDCNDYDKWVNPGMEEICGDGVDNDCDGSDATCADAGTLAVEVVSPGWQEGQCGGTFTDGVCYGQDRALYVMGSVTGNYAQPAVIAVNGRQSMAYIDNTDLTSSDNMMLLKCNSSGADNSITIGVKDGSGNRAADTITYGCSAEASGLLVMLTWDAGDSCATDTDLDLYVKEPDGSYAYDGSAATPNGGSVSGDGVTCYGPVYYVIDEANAAAGDYYIRVHYKSGSTSPAYMLRIVGDEDFDHIYKATGTLSSSNAAAGGTGNFASSDASWTTDTWVISKNSDGEWSIPTAQ